MKTLRAMLVRLAGLFRQRQREAEMNAELRAHLDGLIERNVAAGMAPDEARSAALRQFGGVAQIQERARDERRSVWIEQFLQDVRFAVRALAKSPSFTVTAIVTLALGIGVNAALFSVFNMIAWRPLPLQDPDSLVQISGRNARHEASGSFSHAEYVAYRDNSRALEGLLAFRSDHWTFQSELTARGDPAFGGLLGRVQVELVSENYFAVLGRTVLLGRAFLPGDFTSGATPVIVLSHLFWERHFDGRPDVLGTTFQLGGRLVTVVGVTRSDFPGHKPSPPAGWLPLPVESSGPADYGPGGRRHFGLIGRLKPGVSDAQAMADLGAIAAARAKEFPGEDAKTGVVLKRGLRFVNIPLTPLTLARLSPLFLGFGMVLAIACTNVANLLLARGISRQAEIGVRLTLGAGRGRIVRQLLTENVLLCLVGSFIGLGLGTWLLQVLQPIVLRPLLPAAWLMFLAPTPDIRVLGYTAVLTIGATLVAGLLPALHTANASLFAIARQGGTAFGRGFTPSRLRRWLVIAQVALCLALLSCAGVMARNLFALKKVDLGFDPSAVFAAYLMPAPAITDRHAAFRQALEIARTLPGVAAIGLSTGTARTRVRAAEAPGDGAGEAVNASFVSGEFFDTLGIPLLRGRAFRESELQAASRLVLVSETLARQLWPGQTAVGRALAISEAAWNPRARPESEREFRECEVIGVVRDVVMRYREQNARGVYLPFALESTVLARVYVRPRSDSPAALLEIMRAAEAAGIGLQFDGPVSSQVEQDVLPYYGMAWLSGMLGGLALMLASVGLYGLMAFAVSQRVREIGIRMALGATAERVVGLFVRQGMRLVACGLGLGLVGGGLFALLIGKILYGYINAFDPAAFAVVTVLFGLIALVACWLPARRAAKVDPVVALRAE